MSSEEPRQAVVKHDRILKETKIKKEREHFVTVEGTKSQTTTSESEVDAVKIELRHAIQSRRVAQGLPLNVFENDSQAQHGDEESSVTQLSPEEQRKKVLRRERNRIAAIRCREKRKARLNSLRKEVETLEQHNNNLEEDIALLRGEKDRLALVLNTHECSMSVRLRT